MNQETAAVAERPKLGPLHGLPLECWLPSDHGLIFSVGQICLDKLREVMTEEEIIAAHEGTDQALRDRMRQISCRGCSIKKCPQNFKFSTIAAYHPGEMLLGLCQGNFMERANNARGIERRLREDLSVYVDENTLAAIGFSVRIHAQPSLKNAAVYITFCQNGRFEHEIYALVNKRELHIGSAGRRYEVEPLEDILSLVFALQEALDAILWYYAK